MEFDTGARVLGYSTHLRWGTSATTAKEGDKRVCCTCDVSVENACRTIVECHKFVIPLSALPSLFLFWFEEVKYRTNFSMYSRPSCWWRWCVGVTLVAIWRMENTKSNNVTPAEWRWRYHKSKMLSSSSLCCMECLGLGNSETQGKSALHHKRLLTTALISGRRRRHQS